MKLLFFIPELSGGGAQRVLINLTGALAQRGHEITVSLNKEIIAYEVPSGVDIQFASHNKSKTAGNRITRFTHHIIHYLHYFKHTRRIINDITPDIIITFLQCNTLPILLFHKNIPIISSEHNAYDRKLGFRGHFCRFILNRFYDRVTVLTSFDKGFAKAKGVQNVVTMSNPLSFPPINEKQYKETFHQRKHILACGRLDAWKIKGFDLLIKAFSEATKCESNIELHIAGTGLGKSRRQLTEMAEKNGVADRIIFLDFVQDVQHLMQQYSVFVLSSRTEGFGMALIEAMASGCACISRNLPGPSEIVSDGIDGRLIMNDNVHELSAAMRNMLCDNKQRFVLGFNAIKSVEKYSVERIASHWEVLFRQIK